MFCPPKGVLAATRAISDEAGDEIMEALTEISRKHGGIGIVVLACPAGGGTGTSYTNLTEAATDALIRKFAKAL